MMVLQVLQEAGEEAISRPPSPRPTIHHDPWLIPASPALKSLAASIFEQLETTYPRPARQRSDAKSRRAAIVENIVASLALLSRHHPEGARMAISAKNAGRTRYDRRDFPREVFMQMVGELHQHGLLALRRGIRGGARTTIEPAAKFRQMVSTMEVTLGRAGGAETIILKAPIGRDRPKALIDYEDTPETHAMRADMQAVNKALGAASIGLGNTAPPTPAFLTRRFQIDHPEAPHIFHQHGRLYGGFWLSLPKTERHLLRVNGEPVADLDFAGMFVQLAYLEAGLALPNSDPYEGVEGLPRAAVKMGLSALLCRRGPMQRLPRDLRELAGREWTGKRLQAALEERHPGIAHLFGRRLGLRLMKTESDILMATLLGLFAQGIPALPMHDGIMVPASCEEAARRAMAQASMEIVGTSLPVVTKDAERPAKR